MVFLYEYSLVAFYKLFALLDEHTLHCEDEAFGGPYPRSFVDKLAAYHRRTCANLVHRISFIYFQLQILQISLLT